MSKFNIQQYKGVIPALMTVFDQNENIDEAGMRSLVNYVLEQKVDGLYLTGSTGEGFLMTLEERKRVVEIVMDEVAGRVPVLVHVGAISTKLSIELAQHAYEAGADGVSSVPPFYWKFTDDQIFNYYKEIAEATPLPMIVYNVPLAGLFGIPMVKRLATVENIKGIKYTAATHYEIMQLKTEIGKDFLVYSGSDEMAASGLLAGSDGIIGSFYNVIPDLFIKINKAMEDGKMKEAAELQNLAVQIIMHTLSYGSMAATMKAMLRWIGVNAGYARRPFNNFTEEQEKAMKQSFQDLKKKFQIQGVDFFDKI